jgi:hypothetical protein
MKANTYKMNFKKTILHLKRSRIILMASFINQYEMLYGVRTLIIHIGKSLNCFLIKCCVCNIQYYVNLNNT